MFIDAIIKPASIIALLACLTASSLASPYYVDCKFQGETPSGNSWLRAFPSLQTAIETASTNGGGQIWVKAGVYHPEGISKNATFDLKSGIEIYGGFRGGETNLVQRNGKANRTVLSGDIGRVGSTTDNAYHVLTAAENCRIDSFIISRGNADSIAENRFGGGLRIVPGSKNVVVANCTFEKNSAESGGAIHLTDGELSISNAIFYSNSGDTGGGIAILGQSSLSIQDSIFSSNFSPKSGGAITVGEGGRAKLSGVSFLYNSTDSDGGALSASTSKKSGIELEMLNCTFTKNSAKNNGGALFFTGPFSPVIKGCSFEKNFSPRGAGAIANHSGTTAVVQETTFAKNRGSKGSENIGNDNFSSVVESKAAAEKLAQKTNNALQPAEPAEGVPEVNPEPLKQKLPDLFVHNSKDNTKLKLRSVVAHADYTVLTLGDLTDDLFIKNYRSIEAAARDFYPMDIRFFYIYRNLMHPENNGYIKPFLLKERVRHAQLANELLQTAVPWLCDEMDNQTAKALDPDGKVSVFIFSKTGEEIYQGSLSDTATFRTALTDLAGTVENPYRMDALTAPSIQPINMANSKLVPRIKTNVGTDQFQPLQITPLESRLPFFVKARVEGSKELLNSGNGNLYLGFHIDPLYHVKWNNLAEPLKYILKSPQGVIAPSINSAQRVSTTATDSEPREFILQARKLDLKQPISLQVTYSVHTSNKRNIEVIQQYLIYLEHDTLGGKVIGRQITMEDKVGTSKPHALKSSAYQAILRRFDIDRNGRLTSDEVIGGLRSRFDDIDLNNDGSIDEDEYMDYRENKQP